VPGAVNGYLRPDANFGSVHDPLMTGAMVVIGRAQLGTSHDTVVGFLRAAAGAGGSAHKKGTRLLLRTKYDDER
jgi:hypothetical protein